MNSNIHQTAAPEVNLCMVCCEEMKFLSIGSCDHPICHKCSTRMRVLANQRYCPSCRCDIDQVVFSRSNLKFSEFKLNKLLGNRKYGIRFEDGEVRKAFEVLQDYVCTICREGPLGSMSLLKSHVRKEHDKQFCLICSKNLTLFPFEMKLYSKKELVRHRKDGDADEKSHRGHPECRFCDERYFDNDALLLHLRKSHFWCHFCEHDGKQDYYDVYESLRQHFSESHFLCDEGACINEKFTSVFRDEIDFKAHKLAMHRKKLNKFQAKEARKVEIDYKFESRPTKSNVITGNDYDDVQQDTRRRQGNKIDNDKRTNSNHRYHRGANGTLNFYDYEDVEKDRKKYLGKPHRHEAEEVDQGRSKVSQRMAATRSLSQSEPDIPTHVEDRFDEVDGVIGFSECITDDMVKSESKVKEEKKHSSPPPAAAAAAEPMQLSGFSQPNTSDENFPTLPGAKLFVPPASVKKRTEDFPALPSAAPVAKPKMNTWNNKSMTNAAKPEVRTMNGIVVKTSKSKKKNKQKQPNPSDFPTLGETEVKKNETPKPPPSKFNKFESPSNQNGTHSNKKEKSETNISNCVNNESQKQSKEQETKKPPPGFQSTPIYGSKSFSEVRSIPPGFSKESSQNRPSTGPPGLKPQTAENSSAERNMRLVTMLSKFLDDFNMNIFRDLSGQFRRGLICGQEYYDSISELLDSNLKYVFSELVALLPDEDKQNELLRVHNDAKVRAKQKEEVAKNNGTTNLAADYSKPAQWGAKAKTEPLVEVQGSRCDNCGLMVANCDIQEHLESHGEAFPALPQSTKKKKNYTFISSSRYSKQVPVKSAWQK